MAAEKLAVKSACFSLAGDLPRGGAAVQVLAGLLALFGAGRSSSPAQLRPEAVERA